MGNKPKKLLIITGILACFILFSNITVGQNRKYKAKYSNKDSLTLNFDISGKLLSTPYSHSFDKKNILTINITALSRYYLMAVRDSLLARANRMKNVFTTIIHVWGYKKTKELSNELDSWIKYLKDSSIYASSDGSKLGTKGTFTHFPILPTLKKVRETAFWVYSDDKKSSRRLTDSSILLLTPDSSWVIDGYHPQVRFNLVLKNIFKETIAYYYNESIIKGPSEDEINSFIKQFESQLSEFKKLRNTESERKFKEDVTNLLDSLSDPDIDSIDLLKQESLIEKWEKLESNYNTLYREDDLIKTFSQYEKVMNFVFNWLWYNGGELSIDPFNFTTSDRLFRKFTHKDSLDLRRAKLFDSAYRNMLDCEICKVYKDTNTVRDIAKQQFRGNDYFSRADSLKADSINKANLATFQKELSNLHSFTFPFRTDEDSAGIVQEFNAARNYKRVDTASLKKYKGRFRRLRFANSNIPENKMPAIVVLNLTKNVKLKLLENPTSGKDQSGFQKTLGDSSGIGGAAAIASMFSSSTFTEFGAIAATLVQTPTIQGPNPRVFSVNLAANEKIGLPAIIEALPSPAQKKFQDSVRKAYYIRCDSVKIAVMKILKNRAIANKVINTDNFIDSFISIDSVEMDSLCEYKGNAYKQILNNLESLFTESLQSELNKKTDLINKLINDTSFITRISNIKNLFPPPEKIVLDKHSVADTGYYRSQTIYFKQAGSNIKDWFVLDTTGKDTSLQVAGGYFYMAPKHLITLGIGPEITFNKAPVNNLTAANGQLTNSQDIQNIRFIAGIHIYPWKIFNSDNRFFIHKHYGVSTWSRLSLFLGVSIPNPLENYFTGLSADIVPGLKIHTGGQWVLYTKYNILNNTVQDQASALRFGGWYIGVNIDPLNISSAIISAFK